MATIVHMTSVHSPLDPRIFEKECRTLAEAGHDVSLIAPAERDAVSAGVRIIAVPKASGRIARTLVTNARVFYKAINLRADAYHFHDPELIPWGLALRLMGRIVVYDVHEDYVTSIAQKRYLRPALRRTLAALWDGVERLVAPAFHVVLAERYHAERLPQGCQILNYPRASDLIDGGRVAFSPQSRRLLYTGTVSEDRGALQHAAILAYGSAYEVHSVGRCPAALAERMLTVAGEGRTRLTLVGVDEYVPFARIAGCYTEESWLCGLALFSPTPHYLRKELTKFFEYMHAGLPIVCSDFPAWRALVEEQRIGLCVPPDDPAKVIAALDWLAAHPAEAAAMGERGRTLVRNRFNWESQASELNRMYDEILSKQALGFRIV